MAMHSSAYVGISAKESTLNFSDGSKWTVEPQDVSIPASWSPADSIEVRDATEDQNHYFLTHLRSEMSARAVPQASARKSKKAKPPAKRKAGKAAGVRAVPHASVTRAKKAKPPAKKKAKKAAKPAKRTRRS